MLIDAAEVKVHSLTEIELNEKIVSQIVRAIQKGIEEDVKNEKKAFPTDWHRADSHLAVDHIYTNARNQLSFGNCDVLKFRRPFWEGCLIVDRENRVTYSMMTESALDTVRKDKLRKGPHYLQAIAYVENHRCIPRFEQPAMEGWSVNRFDDSFYRRVYSAIADGRIDESDSYCHYVVAYAAQSGSVTSVRMLLLDRNLSIADTLDLSQYLSVGYLEADTTQETDSFSAQTQQESRTDKLVTLKSGVVPRLKPDTVLNSKENRHGK